MVSGLMMPQKKFNEVKYLYNKLYYKYIINNQFNVFIYLNIFKLLCDRFQYN